MRQDRSIPVLPHFPFRLLTPGVILSKGLLREAKRALPSKHHWRTIAPFFIAYGPTVTCNALAVCMCSR